MEFDAHTWEQRRLGELMEITSVRRVHQSQWQDSGIRFLRARDLVAFDKEQPISDPIFISRDLFQNLTAQSGRLNTNDMLVSGVGTIGIPWLVPSTSTEWYFKDGNIIWLKNSGILDGPFLYHLFKSPLIQRFISEMAGTGTVGTFTIETAKRVPLKIPSQTEQERLGKLFKVVNHLITLHQRQDHRV